MTDIVGTECVASVGASTALNQRARPGASPRATLQSIRVAPVPITVAKVIIVCHHYLHSLPGGTQLAFGVFLGSGLLGMITLGVGPMNAHRLVDGAKASDCLTLTRLWLSDELPGNSESRVLGIVIRALRKHTNIRFLVSYADPTQGHLGTIYMASNWLYTGYSDATPMFDVGDGVARHSRTLSNSIGTHSLKYFWDKGLPAKTVSQPAKHRYLYLLDTSWRPRLAVPTFPYPKKEKIYEDL